MKQLTPLDHLLREAERLTGEDRLVVEVVASAWLGGARQERTLEQRDPEGDLVRQVVGATRGRRAAAAYLALHALATIPDETWRSDVVDSLAAAPSGRAPGWAVDPGTHAPEPLVGAMRWSDPWGSEVTHLLRFAEPVDHSLLIALTTVGGLWVHLVEVGLQESEPEAVLGGLPGTTSIPTRRSRPSPTRWR